MTSKHAEHRNDRALAALAHELRNRLAPISNAAQILKVEGLKGPNFRWSIEVIELQIKRITRLIDMFARSDGPGQGGELVVRLPWDRAAAEPRCDAIPASDNGTGTIPGRRILIVDDNRNHALSLGVLLSSLGHEVVTAYDGPTAVQLACEHRPDLLLVDIGLPGIDGYEVARRCRADLGLERTAFVAMTGYGKEQDQRRAQEAGFIAHFVKPINFDDLRRLLAQSDLLAAKAQ